MISTEIDVELKQVSYIDTRVLSIRRTRRTCPANFGNVRRRAVVKFNQMSGKKLEMSGQAQNKFAYSAMSECCVTFLQNQIYNH